MAREITINPAAKDIAYGEPVIADLARGEPAVEDLARGEPAVEDLARGKPAVEDLVYGELVYWLTLLGSVIVVIGSVIAFVTKANFVSTSYWISSVWQGQSTEEIWNGAVNSVPHGHWYLSHLATGDGLQALGISVAVFSIALGMIAAATALFKLKSTFFGVFALIAAAVITISIFG